MSEIRKQVFVIEQGVPLALELDEFDAQAMHFVALSGPDDRAVATARLLENGHIGRMAVLQPFRKQSIGQKLLETIIDEATNLGHATLFLNAQTTAVGFYEKAGFQAEGEVFMDAGIEHVRMSLKLDAQQ